MQHTDTVVIGAGQAGLAMSRSLTERGVEHVVLERGRVADRWRNETWDSLRLLSPNWMSRLPGWSYKGPDPHGFMTAAQVVSYLQGYADASNAPVEEESAVERVELDGDRFDIISSDQTWRAGNVVVATGWCDRPAVPAMAFQLDPELTQVVPAAYRRPADLPDGGVLVVGASATGVQLADELAAAGRDVVLAVGNHSRLPREYRGMDILWWLERMGTFDRTIDQVSDPVTARREPSFQLVGRPDHRTIDLGTLRDGGVELAGRMILADGQRVHFAGDLAHTIAAADVRLDRILADIDCHIEASCLGAEVLERESPRPIPIEHELIDLDLRNRQVRTVIWATGHRRAYPWLHVPVLDDAGEIRQRHGVTRVPGLYVLGQRFQHRRNSNFIDGVGRDAIEVAEHVIHHTRSIFRT
jgi:putative flavoprotein involved in K+ transport